MTRNTFVRLTATSTLVLVLAAFAVPATAAPAGSWTDSWSFTSLISWFDQLWTGFVTPEAPEQSSQADGPRNVFDKANNVLEPDGLKARDMRSSFRVESSDW